MFFFLKKAYVLNKRLVQYHLIKGRGRIEEQKAYVFKYVHFENPEREIN